MGYISATLPRARNLCPGEVLGKISGLGMSSMREICVWPGHATAILLMSNSLNTVLRKVDFLPVFGVSSASQLVTSNAFEAQILK